MSDTHTWLLALTCAGSLLLGGVAERTAEGQAGAPAPPKAVPAPPGKPGVVITDIPEIKARVKGLHRDKRRLALAGPRGNTVMLKAGPEVKNLDQVKAGDQLVVRYLESIALFVRKSGEPPAATEAAAVEVAAKGQKPAGAVVDTAEITA